MPHVFWVCPLRSSTCTKTSAKPQFHKLTPKSNQGASKGHATSEESIRQATLMTFIKCRNRGVHSSIDWKGCSKTNVPPHTATRRHKSIDLAKSRNYNIYIYIQWVKGRKLLHRTLPCSKTICLPDWRLSSVTASSTFTPSWRPTVYYAEAGALKPQQDNALVLHRLQIAGYCHP